MNDASLNGKIAFVTGGRQGIGRAIVETLAGAGAAVAAVDANPAVADLAAEIGHGPSGGDVIGLRADVTSGPDVAAAVAQANQRLGRVDILVNNAGIVGRTRAFSWDGDDEVWLRTIDVNLVGTYRVTKAVVPQMIEARAGRVINVSSISGKQGSLGNSAYSASKHGVIGLTRTLALELAPRQISVNALVPGWVETEMARDGFRRLGHKSGGGEDEGRAMAAKMAPLGRVLDPEEVAGLAAYLASDEAGSITGQAITIDGGQVMP